MATGITAGSIEALDGNSDAFKTLARFMARMIKDKVAGVYAASLKVLRELVTFQVSCITYSHPLPTGVPFACAP